MRTTPVLLAAAAIVAATLAGCSSVSGVGGSCTPVYSAGDASKLVTAADGGIVTPTPTPTPSATGTPSPTDTPTPAPSATPATPVTMPTKATFPTPLVTQGTELSQVVAGSGTVAQKYDVADIDFGVYNGATGALIGAAGYGQATPIFVTAGKPDQSAMATGLDLTTLNNAVQCAQAGSRMALTETAADLFGAGSGAQYGFKDTDTIVVIVDVVSTYLGKANGINQLPLDGMPSVATAVDGTPGISILATDPPADLRISTIKAGNGAAVQKGDSVVIHYTGYLWPAKQGDQPTIFDSTWDPTKTTHGEPTVLKAVSLSDSSTGLVPGFAQALIGAKVGSQVLVVVPPAEGYPTGSNPSTIPAGSTMIFVFDVLGIQK